MRYRIWVDGGSKGNGTENQRGYGSSLAVSDTGKSVRRYEFGNCTNNEAEYLALLSTLQNLLGAVDSGFLTADDEVEILMDSALVVNQVNRDWKVKQPHLEKIWLECCELFDLVGCNCDISLVHVPREVIVEKLGH